MELKNLLNSEQYDAVMSTEGPLLILAGAGSGKTRVITYRIAHMIGECGIQPYEILAITFTNKAAGEMKERVKALVGDIADSMWISTFHSSCARILRRDIDALGYKKDFTIYDNYDQRSLVKQVMKELDISDKDITDREILSEISSAKNLLIGPARYKKENEYHYRKNRIADAYLLYQKKIKSNNALDFDDLLMKTVELFLEHPDILEKYRRKFRYVLVDEYQDTNHAQYRLVLLLTEKSRNLCVVGDDDQSIYKFRGADITNILNFEKDFKETKVVKLEKNYRSVANILNAANAVIKQNEGRKVKSLVSTKEPGGKIKVYRAHDDSEEAAFVAREILRQYRDGRNYKEFAILYRTNAQSRKFEERFIKEGITYRIIGSLRFYDRKEIKDLLAYFKVILNPFDEVSLRRIINVPKRAIGDSTVVKLQEQANHMEESLFDTILSVEEYGLLSARAQSAVVKFREMILGFMEMAAESSLMDLAEQVLTATGYLKELQNSKNPEDLSRVENLEEFVNVVREYEDGEAEPSLGGFLESVALVADIDSYDENADAVTLMTLHSAKGLEFPVVFMAGMENGVFPGNQSFNDPEEMEESRRLCYVGITRAKEDLYMTHADHRYVFGRLEGHTPSDFLMDIPSNLKTFLSEKRDVVAKSVNPHTIGYTDKKKNIFDMDIEQAMARAGQILDRPDKKVLSIDTVLPGTKVRHPKFGVGTVVNVEAQKSDHKITIAFDAQGIKHLMLSMAPLELA